jgi:hypothetical protein
MAITKRIRLRIDLTKIDKNNIFVGKKGKYLDADAVLSDGVDDYGNTGFIAQVNLKENQKDSEGNYIKTPIIGNAIDWEVKKQTGAAPQQAAVQDDDDDGDLPF